MTRATELDDNNDLEAALPLLRDVTWQAPNLVLAWSRLGSVYIGLGMHRQALEALRRAFLLAPVSLLPLRRYLATFDSVPRRSTC
jgi:tetratricopeptide (TPR) repeat protein